MFRTVALLCATALSCWPAADGAAPNDWLIVPGKRMGPISQNTTRADLVRFFGAKYVEDDYVSPGGDADPEMGTIVHQDDSGIELHILWRQAKPDPRVNLIVICPGAGSGTACRWHTAEGITIGTPLKTLEHLNGRPFKLMGMDWDYGGAVVSFDQGRLESLRPKCGSIALQLEEGSGDASEQRATWIDQISGDGEFWSSDPAMRGVNPAVQWMTISFEGCGKTQS